jgi:hypothetical protein
MRPYPVASSRTADSRVAAAALARWAVIRPLSVAASSSGTSPLTTGEVGGQQVQCDLGGASSARNFVLVNDHNAGQQCGDGRGNDVTLVAHHREDVGRVEFLGGGKNVANQWNPGEVVKNLGLRGLHPGALSCGKDDDGQVGIGHSVFSS